MIAGTLTLTVAAAAIVPTVLLRAWQKQIAGAEKGGFLLLWFANAVILAIPIISLALGISKRPLVDAYFQQQYRVDASSSVSSWATKVRIVFLCWPAVAAVLALAIFRR